MATESAGVCDCYSCPSGNLNGISEPNNHGNQPSFASSFAPVSPFYADTNGSVIDIKGNIAEGSMVCSLSGSLSNSEVCLPSLYESACNPNSITPSTIEGCGDSRSKPMLFWGKTKEEYKEIQQRLPYGLDLYDFVRKPRNLEFPDFLEQETDLTESDLRIDLSCPICMGILQHTVVVKDCFHRFCAECIEKCVRTGIRECPQCRIHVASRRSLRPDIIFDQIVRRIFLDVEQFESLNYQLLEKSNRERTYRCEGRRDASSDSNSSKSSYSQCPVYVEPSGEMKRRNTIGVNGDPNSFSIDAKARKADKRKRRKEWELAMKKIPSDGNLRFRFLPDVSLPGLPALQKTDMITRGQITLKQLGKNIMKRLNLATHDTLQFYTKECRCPFKPYDTLAYLHQRSLGLTHQYLIVYYTTRGSEDCGGGVLDGRHGYMISKEESTFFLSALMNRSTSRSIGVSESADSMGNNINNNKVNTAELYPLTNNTNFCSKSYEDGNKSQSWNKHTINNFPNYNSSTNNNSNKNYNFASHGNASVTGYPNLTQMSADASMTCNVSTPTAFQISANINYSSAGWRT